MGYAILILLIGIALTFLGYKFDSLINGRYIGPLFILVGAFFVLGAVVG